MHRALLFAANALIGITLTMGTGCCLTPSCGGVGSCGLGSAMPIGGGCATCGGGPVYQGEAVVVDGGGCGCGESTCGGDCGVPACGGCGSCGLCQGLACTGRSVLGLGAGILHRVGNGIHFMFSSVNGCASCGSGCGEVYWHDWINTPPTCDSCDSCGHWTGDNVHGIGKTLFSGGCGVCGHGGVGGSESCSSCSGVPLSVHSASPSAPARVAPIMLSHSQKRPHVARMNNCPTCASQATPRQLTLSSTPVANVGTGVRVVSQEEVVGRVQQLQNRR